MATASGAIVAVNPATTIVTPTANVFNYAYCDNSKNYLGTLNGITNQPVFVSKINQGVAALQLDIDHYPKELSFGNLIRVTYPSGQIAGWWRYEGRKSVMAAKNGYTITLTPLSSELKEVSFNANYSADTTQPTAALGSATFDVPVLAAIARTKHLTAGTIANNGTAYSYVFNNSTGQDPLNQAMIFGGSSWWYFVDSQGVVSMNNASPYAHTFTVGQNCSAGEWDDDILSLFNGQPVIGGTGPNGVTSLTAIATDTNPGNPYSTVNIGERTAQAYQDTSLVDQSSVNSVASSLLTYAERVTSTRKIQVTNYTTRRPQPGDATYLYDVDPASGDPTQPGNLVKQGPYLITDVSEFGGTFRYEITVSASMVVPVVAFKPTMTQDQALLKLIQNPTIQPVSNNGLVGTIGNGVVGGAASSGALNKTPAQPVGVSASTGIDNLAQLNNAFVSLTWSANSASDGVSVYLVRYRKSNDPDTAASYYTQQTNSLGLKVGGLYQGTSYTFQVLAQNNAGVQSAWTTLQETTQSDTTPPAVPTNLTAYRTPRGALVSWQPGIETSGGTAPDLQGYSLQVSIPSITNGWIQVTPSGAYSLNTSLTYTAPNGTPEGSLITFRVAAIDWSNNLSAYTSPSAAIYTDGTSISELTVGQMNVLGLLTATGGFTTRPTMQSSGGSAGTGPGVDISSAGLTLYDGTTNNYGGGVGVTGQLNATNGNAFFSGTVSASQIQGVSGAAGGSGPRMWLDLKDTTQGVGPLLDVNDGSFDRIQIGNLAANSVSPAQYGVRINDNTGAPIADAYGLIGAVQLANSSLPGSSFTAVAGSTPVQQSGTNTTFSVVNRTQKVLVLFQSSAQIESTGGSGQAADLWFNLGVVGVGNSVTINAHEQFTPYNSPVANVIFDMPFTIFYYTTLAVGTYTAAFYMANGNNGFNGYGAGNMIVLQLGG